MNACRKTEVDCTYSKVWPYMGISYRLGRLSPTKGCRYSLQKKKAGWTPEAVCKPQFKNKNSWPCRQTSYDFSADHYTRLATPAPYTKYEPVLSN